MILTFDLETYGFSKNIICGSIAYRKKDKEIEIETYDKKEEIINRIKEIGNQQKKQGHNLYCYAHNLAFDFYRIINITDPKLEIINKGNPLMAKYNENTWFLDTMGLMNISLKKIGENINEQKKEPSNELKEKIYSEKITKLTKSELQELKEYNQQDCKTLLKAIEYIKNNLKQEGFKPKKIMTAGQIAQGLFNRKMEKSKNKWNLYEIKNKRLNLIQTKHAYDVHKAYRGGRIEAIHLGKYTNCTGIDYNSLYPHAAMQIPFPKLTTEQKIINPKENYNTKEIINQLGVSKIKISIPKTELGILPIRWNKNEIYPKHKCDLIGTWTNLEISNALDRGAIINGIEYTINYAELEENPLKNFMQEMYEKRKKSDMNSYFYKIIMNSLIGKFGQRNHNEKIKITSIDLYPEMEKQGYKGKTRIGENYIYTKDLGISNGKNYAPIIPAYVTAKSREIMHHAMSKIKTKDIMYCATDGIIFRDPEYKGKDNYLNKFKLGNEIGEWKIQTGINGKPLINEDIFIYGKNNYRIGKDQRYSGIGKAFLGNEKEEKIKYKQMTTLGNITEETNLGEFKEINRDLKETYYKSIQEKKEINTFKLIPDEEEKIDWFIKEGYI